MMTALSVPLDYPLALADEQRAINRIAVMVAMMDGRLGFDRDSNRERLRKLLLEALREGRFSITVKAIRAAEEEGDEIADATLRRVFGEIDAGMLAPPIEHGHPQIRAYIHRVLALPPKTRPRGPRWHDHWCRNIYICALIDLVCRQYGVRPTRNRNSRRAKRGQSGISLVVAGLARNKIVIDEDTVQRHIWLGLPGELVRQCAAEFFADPRWQ
jgi:hypothetical protein